MLPERAPEATKNVQPTMFATRSRTIVCIELRDRTVTLGPGELFVVPAGIEHRPVARRGEVKLLLIEPEGTPNTGDEATATAKVEI